jgi:predicted nucleotidyltransferase
MASDQSFAVMEHTLKKATAALRDAGVPFLVGGSLASWTRGGPETRHDLDFVVKPEDAERALEVLAETGMRPERPPEGWLYKAWDGDVQVDLIFRPKGIEVTDEVIERGDDLEVLAIRMRVMALEDMLTTKLLALDEHSLNFSPLLQIARALREQIDWEALRGRTAGSPYSRAFFALVEDLGIAPTTAPAAEGRSRVRVVDPPEKTARRAG